MAREAEGEEGGRQEEIETDKTEREMEHWRQRPIVGVTRLPLGCQLIFPAGYRCGLWCCLVVTLYHHSTYILDISVQVSAFIAQTLNC